MSKADELAIKYCRFCPNNKICTFVCMSVMLELWADSNKSPHELDMMMREARETMRLKESVQ